MVLILMKTGIKKIKNRKENKMPYNKNFKKESLKKLIDDLNRFLFILFFILFILTFFIRNFFLDVIKFLVFSLILFRLFSKNKTRRYKENQMYLKIKRFLLKPFSLVIRNFKERDSAVYRKCHKCKTILKLPLPKKLGMQHAKCPHCGNKVTLFTLRKIKIEVIKRKKKYEE